MLPIRIWALILAATVGSTTRLDQSKRVRVRQSDSTRPEASACGAIIDDVNEGYAYHWASDAYACLTSVPFNDAVATRFIKYINETIQFQSTLGYLKAPPTGYQQPAIDIVSELSQIQANIQSGTYRNQYQFETDVQNVLFRAHDSHLYMSGGVTAAFSFQAPYSITAASVDGKSAPKVYLTHEIVEYRNGGQRPSAIRTINGQDTVEYLSRLASLNALGGIEPHADWNQLFDTPALYTQGIGSIWDTSVSFYPGDKIELIMEDGTDYSDYWLALWNEPYATGPLTTGGDFYNYFVLGIIPESFNESEGVYNPAYTQEGPRTPATPDLTWRNVTNGAYPDPDIQQVRLGVNTEGIVSGYFLPDVDTAVLSIPSFAQYGRAIQNFSEAVIQFIDGATDANLSRVVIDLQQNTGGTVVLAFSTFKKFFPQVEPFAGSRRRNHQLGNILGEAYTAYFNTLDPESEDTQYNDTLADEWVVTPKINPVTGRNFSSWAEYTGPIQVNGDSFSLTERYNLSSVEYSVALFEGFVPRGYTPQYPLDYTEPPFDAKNIVLLTDGACSSACALFVEMFAEVGVKTIVAGGRPIDGPMQAVGGNRGAAVYTADEIDAHISGLSLDILNVSDTVLASVPQISSTGYRDSGVFTPVLAINLRDQVRPNDTMPLQFKYEAADCRIFYTLNNVYNMSRLWRDAAAAAFDDSTLCVQDSTGYVNATKPPPKPSVAGTYASDFDFGEPDAMLDTDGFDLSGGPQNSPSSSRSWTVDQCTAGGCGSNRNKVCEPVELRPCSNRAAPLQESKACVPRTGIPSNCPAGTVWTAIGNFAVRLDPGKASGKSAGSGASQKTREGACYPTEKFTGLCKLGS